MKKSVQGKDRKKKTRNVEPGTLNRRVSASYEAAQGGRRLRLWRPSAAGPNAAFLGDLHQLRNRSRDSVRNNGWMAHGITNWVSNEIGVGIFPEPRSPSPEFNKAAKKLWDDWTQVADADGVLDYYGLLALCARERRESGEMFLRIRPRTLSYGLPVPMQLQCLEAEFCPHDHNDITGKVRSGIEFNGVGKRTAYWMYRSHPGDPFINTLNTDLVPVPASSVIHHYAPLRAGQIRGLPWTVQALIKAHDFDEYDDAELLRKKNRAAYTGAITQPAPTEEEYLFSPITGEPLTKDANGVPTFQVEGGSFWSLLPGEDLKLFEGDPSGQGYADFVRQQLLGFAAAMDIPYEFLTGDMAKVNDRLMRVILNEFHRLVEQTQWHLTIPQLCIPIWEHFVDFAVLSGALTAPGYETQRADYLLTQWNTHRWPYLNPLQDVEAAGKEIMYGLQSRTGAAAERGLVAEEIDEQNAADKERAQKLGLNYETQNSGQGDQETGRDEDEEDDDEQSSSDNRLRSFRRVNADLYR